MLQRSINACNLEKDCRVKVRRSARRGTVIDVEHNEENIPWVSNKPYFIKVKFDDGVIQHCHYSQLKRSKI